MRARLFDLAFPNFWGENIALSSSAIGNREVHTMLVHCPSCNKNLNVPDSAAGKKARCPGCNNVFGIAAPAAIAVTPSALKAQALQTRLLATPSGRQPERHDNIDNNEDDRPRRRRSRSTNPAKKAKILSRLLMTASFAVIGYFIIGLFGTYYTFVAANERVKEVMIRNQELIRGAGNRPANMNFDNLGVSPTGPVLAAFVRGALIYGSCVTFMLIGAVRATQLFAHRMVMAGVIIALVLGSLGVILAVYLSMHNSLTFSTLPQSIRLLAHLGTTVVLLLAGIWGLIILGQPAVRAAFDANDGGRRGRRRVRDDRYDDDEDDADDRKPRRRRPRDADGA